MTGPDDTRTGSGSGGRWLLLVSVQLVVVGALIAVVTLLRGGDVAVGLVVAGACLLLAIGNAVVWRVVRADPDA